MSLHRALHKEALPLQSLLEHILQRHVPVVVKEDNTQAISAVKSGYSPNLRHLSRVARVSVACLHELFHPCVVEDVISGELFHQPDLGLTLHYHESASHKGDFFTKPLARDQFEKGRHMLGMRTDHV